MILVVCLNLAVDRTIEVDHLDVGQVHRSESIRLEAGSKGVNVARVLKTLGVPCVLTGFLGGPAGEFIAQGLGKEGIACAPCLIQDESRSCYILIETRTSRQTVVKVNNIEGAALLGRSIHDLADATEAARVLCTDDSSLAMITLGSKGAVLASKKEGYVFTAPAIPARNSVGSGDAVFAGLAAGLVRGLPMHEMGVLAVAAGAANALHGGGHCTLEEITQLEGRVEFRPIDYKT
jgi:fructose-1-phosphate kinase PfkB-like protein